MGITMFEFMKFPNYTKDYFFKKTRCRGIEKVYQALKDGKGVIVCSAHFSNWEWLAVYSALHGLKVNAVVRPLDNPLLDHYIEKYRTLKMVKIIPRKIAVKKCYQVLKKNKVLALVIDQNQAVGGEFVPFFGELASTMKGPSVYHKKLRSPVFFAYDKRDTNGFHEIVFSDSLKMSEDNKENLKVINEYLEGIIKKNPELYFWVHPRWKKRPEGAESFYKGIRI